MKKITYAYAFILALGVLSCKSEYSAKAVHEEEGDKRMAMQAMAELEAEMISDPTLARPTPEVLQQTFQDVKRGKHSSSLRTAEPKWVEKGPTNISGRSRTALIDQNDPSGNTVWVGSVSGGLWKTTDFGSSQPTWQHIDGFPSSLAIGYMVQDPSNPSRMYFSTGEGYYNTDATRGNGIWRSEDGGNTWSQLSSTTGSRYSFVLKMAVSDDGTVYACTRSEGVMRSRNNGATWQKVLGGGVGGAFSDRSVDIEIASNGTIYVSLGAFSADGIYRSTNGGNTWTSLNDLSGSGLPKTGFERIEIASSQSNPNVVVALFEDDEDSSCLGIYRSTNGGNTWSSLPVPGAVGMDNFARTQAWYDLMVSINPSNPDHIIIGAVDLLHSLDGGQTWLQICQWYGARGYQYVHADHHDVHFFDGNSDLGIVVNDGGIYSFNYKKQNAQGAPKFNFKGNDLNITQFYTCDYHPDLGSPKALAGAQDNGTQYFSQLGTTATNEVTGGDGGWCFIDKDEPNIQVSTYVYNTFYITNNEWSWYDRYEIGDNTGRFINPMDYDSQFNTLIGASDDSYLSRIRRVGTDNMLDSIYVPELNSTVASAITADPTRQDYFWVGTPVRNVSGGGTYASVLLINSASTDSPKVEREIKFNRLGRGSYLRCITIDPDNPDRITLIFSNYGIANIWESTDRGSTWRSKDSKLPNMPVRWMVYDPKSENSAYIATELGVWKTDNYDATTPDWSVMENGIPQVRTSMLKYRKVDHTLFAATYGRGLFSAKTCVSGEENEEIEICEGKSVTHRGQRFSKPGEYQISVNQDGDCPLQINLTVNAIKFDIGIPDTIFMRTDEVRTLSTNEAYNKYLWAAGNSTSSKSTFDLDGDRLGEGTHTLYLVIAKDGCDKTNKYTVIVEGSSSISEADREGVVIYPNPTTDYIEIRSDIVIEGDILIYDILGRTVKSVPSKSRKNITIDVSSLQQGSYRVVSTDKVLNKPMVKM